MSRFSTSCFVLGLLCLAGASPRSRRAAEKELDAAETRVDPYLYDRGFMPLEGYGHEGYGVVGPMGPIYKAPYIDPHAGYGYGGVLRTGINEGSLALGNKGEQFYRHGSDGGYLDGSYRSGGAAHQGGFQSGEGYKDDKHHVADDFSNKAFHSGVQGSRKDIGNGQVFDKNQAFSENAFNKLGENEEKAHQKGHHRTGFHKSYHKDESGKDESFYDSDHDLGNHEFGKQYVDEFGSNGRSGVKGGEHLNEYAAGERGMNGFEGNGKLIAHNQGYKDRFGNTVYYDNGDRYGKYGGGQTSQLGKYGYQNGFQNGYNSGRNLDASRMSGGYGPFGY